MSENNLLNQFLLDFNGVSCPGCVKSIEKTLADLPATTAIKVSPTTGNSLVKTSLNIDYVEKKLKKFQGCCENCIITLQSIKNVNDGNTTQTNLFLAEEMDDYHLIKMQYAKALKQLSQSDDVACSEYCVCKTTTVDRKKEFPQAPSLAVIHDLTTRINKYLRQGMNVLDFGCGTGHDALQIAPIIEPGNMIGIDVTPEMIAFATHAAQKLGIENVEFKIGADLSNIPKNALDVVYLNNVFNILNEKQQILQQIFERLNKNDFCIIADEFTDENLPNELKADPSFQCGGLAGAESLSVLEMAAKKAGFRKVDIEIVRHYTVEYRSQNLGFQTAIVMLWK